MGYSALLMSTAGLGADHRGSLEKLHRAFSGPFTADEAAITLGIGLAKARRLVRYLADQGWLDRVRRGLYLPVPLDAHRSGIAHKDAWLVASVAFSPAYIAGWSAAEHWDLTEQIFREVFVVTGRRPRDRHPLIGDTTYVLHTLAVDKHFGLEPVWRGGNRINVTDPSRTVVDLLADPRWGGGIRHISEMVVEYFAGSRRDDAVLLGYGDRLGNRAVFKRLGFLIERLGIDAPRLIDECVDRRSSGVSALDPSVDARGRILTRWGLRVNVDLEAGTA